MSEAAPRTAPRSDLIPLRRLREAYLHLTNRCASGCRHCYASTSPLLKFRELSAPAWRQAIDDLVALGAENLVFIGGDPFQREDIFELIEHVTQHHELALRIFYNRHVTPECAQRLLEAGNSRLTMVVSLEGHEPAVNDIVRGEGNFERTLAGLRNLLAVGLVPVVNTFVHSGNVDHLPDLASFLDDLGIERQHLLLPHNRGHIRRSPELIPSPDRLVGGFRRLRQSLEDTGLFVDNFAAWERRLEGGYDLCNAGYDLITIGPEGDVYPCQVTVGDRNFLAGSIKEQPLEEIWRHSPVMRWVRGASIRCNDTCMDCSLRSVCGGECPVQSYYHAEAERGRGSLEADFPYCHLTRAMIEEMLGDVPAPNTDGLQYIECT